MAAVGILVPNSLPYHDLAALAPLLDRHGYDCAWYPDSRFLRDPFVGLSVLAQHTHVPLIGIATTDPYARHPALAAAALASVSEMGGPRVAVALGAGSSGLRALGIDRSHPVATVRRAITTMRSLFEGQAVAFSDSGETVRLEFDSPAVAIWVGTRSPRMLQMAGEMADGVILGHLCQPAAVERALLEVSGAADRRLPHLARPDVRLRLQVIVGADEELVTGEAQRVAAWVLRQHAGRFGWLRELGIAVPEALADPSMAVVSPRDTGRARLAIPPSVVDAFVIRAESVTRAAATVAGLAARWPVIVRLHSTDGTPHNEVARAFGAALAYAAPGHLSPA